MAKRRRRRRNPSKKQQKTLLYVGIGAVVLYAAFVGLPGMAPLINTSNPLLNNTI